MKEISITVWKDTQTENEGIKVDNYQNYIIPWITALADDEKQDIIFSVPLLARYVKIDVFTWVGHPSIRVGVI